MRGQRIGYVRVSSFDQDPERQLDQIQVDKLFTDKASDKDTQRPQLNALLSFVREGDTVVVHSMDRLARNLDDLRRLVQTLTKRGIRIEFVKECLSFTGEDSPMANLLLSVMGAFAGWCGIHRSASMPSKRNVKKTQRSTEPTMSAAGGLMTWCALHVLVRGQPILLLNTP